MTINVKLLRATYKPADTIVKKRNIKKPRGIFCINNQKFTTAVSQLINKHFVDIFAYQKFISKIK